MKTPQQYRQESEARQKADKEKEDNADTYTWAIIVFFILCVIFKYLVL